MATLQLPGLIDSHVHLREPGATQKEDFETGTKAAIAGGFTCVLDMPNNPEPTVSPEALEKKIQLTHSVTLNEVKGITPELYPSASPQDDKTRIYCDLGFHFGATADSTQYFGQIKDKVFGLKVYMNHTTGTLLQEDPEVLNLIFSSWPKNKVLMVHAEGETLKKAIELAKRHSNKLHVCHISLAAEVDLIRNAKKQGLPITCEVSCHHLFLTEKDRENLGPFATMRPPLYTKADQEALWNGIDDQTIDTIASDHAPHTKQEKINTPPPNGVPGLETTLPLLLTALAEGRLTEKKLVELTSENPRKIFNIPTQFDTVVEVDMDRTYVIDSTKLYTKCTWTPFEKMKVVGKIKRVVLKGQIVFQDGEVLEPPKGQVVFPV